MRVVVECQLHACTGQHRGGTQSRRDTDAVCMTLNRAGEMHATCTQVPGAWVPKPRCARTMPVPPSCEGSNGAAACSVPHGWQLLLHGAACEPTGGLHRSRHCRSRCGSRATT